MSADNEKPHKWAVERPDAATQKTRVVKTFATKKEAQDFVRRDRWPQFIVRIAETKP